MDFFEHQERARRRTSLLLALYVASVSAIVLAVYAIARFAAGSARNSAYSARCFVDNTYGCAGWFDPKLFGIVAFFTMGLIFLASLYRIFSLGGSGAAVAESLGGVPLSPGTAEATERRLLNIVEEMALASGVAVPSVYIIEDVAINAFAAGTKLDQYVVTVTRGALNQLNRDQLQGVIGHEFSHILNGDMRLNVRLIGILFGILALALTGRFLMRTAPTGGKDDDKAAALMILAGGSLFIIGYIGVFFANLIKSAVSRQREFLADASAVQFTRNPYGIAGALKKIGGYPAGSRLETHRAEEVSHMFFANGVAERFFALLATHPPLEERIRRIDPDFRGAVPATSAPEAADTEAGAAGFATLPPRQASYRATSQTVVNQVGRPLPEHLDLAQALLASIPPPIKEMTRNTLGAQAVLLAMFLHEPGGPRDVQLELVAGPLLEQMIAAESLLAPLGTEYSLPLVDLALPALKTLSPEQFAEFRRVLSGFMQADNKLTLHEYALLTLITHTLQSAVLKAPSTAQRYKTAASVAPFLQVILSAVAYSGSADEAAAERAFAAGCGATRLTLLAPQQCHPGEIDRALAALSQAAPLVKRDIIGAISNAIIVDGKITADETELLRAICAVLACPLPPFIPTAGA